MKKNLKCTVLVFFIAVAAPYFLSFSTFSHFEIHFLKVGDDMLKVKQKTQQQTVKHERKENSKRAEFGFKGS